GAAHLSVGALVSVDPETGVVTPIAEGGSLHNVTGIAIEAPGTILVATAGGGASAIVRVDPETGGQTVVASGGFLVSPFSLALAPGGQLYVADSGGGAGLGRLVRVD